MWWASKKELEQVKEDWLEILDSIQAQDEVISKLENRIKELESKLHNMGAMMHKETKKPAAKKKGAK